MQGSNDESDGVEFNGTQARLCLDPKIQMPNCQTRQMCYGSLLGKNGYGINKPQVKEQSQVFIEPFPSK